MKKLFLLSLHLFVNCYGMAWHPALSEECYQEYARDLLKSFEKFGSQDTYNSAIENYMYDTIQDCVSNDKKILKAATLLIEPSIIQYRIPKPKTADDWICIIFAEQMQKLLIRALGRELNDWAKESNLLKGSREEYGKKVRERYTGEKIFYARLVEAKKYAETILAIIHKK